MSHVFTETKSSLVDPKLNVLRTPHGVTLNSTNKQVSIIITTHFLVLVHSKASPADFINKSFYSVNSHDISTQSPLGPSSTWGVLGVPGRS